MIDVRTICEIAAKKRTGTTRGNLIDMAISDFSTFRIVLALRLVWLFHDSNGSKRRFKAPFVKAMQTNQTSEKTKKDFYLKFIDRIKYESIYISFE